jgi:hypothetical protein
MVLAAALLLFAPPHRDAGVHNVTTLIKDLKLARQQAGAFYEKYLWRSSHLVEDALKYARWSSAKSSLIAQGARVDEENPNHAVIDLDGAGFTTKSGLKHHLEVRCEMSYMSFPGDAFDNGIVRSDSYFVANPNIAYSDFVKAKPYPANSMFAKVLQRPGVKTLAKKKPTVSEIKVSYDPEYPTLDEETVPGQHWPYVISEQISLSDKKGGGTLEYLATAFFEPEHDIDGKPVAKGFVYRDKVGEVRNPYGLERESMPYMSGDMAGG